MRGFNFRGIRWRLLLLVLLAAAPALALVVFTALEDRRGELQEARQDALSAARQIALHQRHLIETGYQFLATLAGAQEVGIEDPARCNRFFATALARFQLYSNAGTIAPDGSVVCSGIPVTHPLNVADRPYFRRALETGHPMSGYLIGRVSGRPTLTLVYPVPASSGEARHVLFASLDLSWLLEELASARLPAGSTLTLIDHDGIVLARYPEPGEWVGQRVPESGTVLVEVLQRHEEGSLEGLGLDGVGRLYGFVPLLGQQDGRQAHLVVAVPRAQILAQADRVFTRNLAALAAAAALALAAAWFGGDLFIRKPIGRILAATGRLREGELGARAEGFRGGDELNQLARAFNEMAEVISGSFHALRDKNQVILDSTAEGICELDPDGRVTFVNRAGAEMLGWDPVEAARQPLHAFMGCGLPCEACGQAEACPILRTATRGIPAHVGGALFRRQDGSTFPVEYRSAPIRQDGRVRGAVVTFNDVTERKRAEETLRRSEEHFRALIDNAQDIITVAAADGTILYESPSVERLLGYRPEELMGRSALEFVHPDDRTRVADGIAHGSRIPGHVTALEFRFRHKDGSWRLLEGLGKNLLDDPLVAGIVVNTRDITDRALAEERLRQSEKLAAMGELLAGVAHELNNPLSVVMAQTAMLRMAADDPSLAARADKIARAADRAARIVKNFLALARHRPPERQEVQLNTVVREALELLAYPLKVDNVAVVTDLAPDLPALRADPHQLHQVLVNLITNAHQAMRETAGERRLTFVTRLDPAGRRARLGVSDTGPGIPPEILSRVFEPFFTTKPPGQGTGLGLSLCQGIVEAHGGTIVVETERERGVTFWVELPLGETGEAAAGSPPMAERPLGPLSLLVVDDEPDVAAVLADMLTGDGHQVETAPNGRRALEKIREGEFDLIISDLRMPELDGPGLWQEIQHLRPDLMSRVVFITGDTLGAGTREFLERANRPTLDKPFLLEDVRKAVQEALLSVADR
jgi:PAS domain S-box-containing protein